MFAKSCRALFPGSTPAVTLNIRRKHKGLSWNSRQFDQESKGVPLQCRYAGSPINKLSRILNIVVVFSYVLFLIFAPKRKLSNVPLLNVIHIYWRISWEDGNTLSIVNNWKEAVGLCFKTLHLHLPESRNFSARKPFNLAKIRKEYHYNNICSFNRMKVVDDSSYISYVVFHVLLVILTSKRKLIEAQNNISIQKLCILSYEVLCCSIPQTNACLT
jgi:hypothetical protein